MLRKHLAIFLNIKKYVHMGPSSFGILAQLSLRGSFVKAHDA